MGRYITMAIFSSSWRWSNRFLVATVPVSRPKAYALEGLAEQFGMKLQLEAGIQPMAGPMAHQTSYKYL